MSTDFGNVSPWYVPVTSFSPYSYLFHNPSFYHPPEYTPPPTPAHVFHSPQPPPYYTPPTHYTSPYVPDTSGTPWFSTYQYEIQHPNPNFSLTIQSHNVQSPLSCFTGPSVAATQFSHEFVLEQQPEFVAPEVFDESPESPVLVPGFPNSNCHQTEDKFTEILEKIGKNLAESSRIIKEMSSKWVSPPSHVPVVDKLDNKGKLERTMNCASVPQLNISARRMFDESPEKSPEKEFIDENSSDITFEAGNDKCESSREIVDNSVGELDFTETDESDGRMLALDSVSIVVDSVGFENKMKKGCEETELKDIDNRKMLKSECLLALSSVNVESTLDEGGSIRGKVSRISTLKKEEKDGDMKENGEENALVESENVGNQTCDEHSYMMPMFDGYNHKSWILTKNFQIKDDLIFEAIGVENLMFEGLQHMLFENSAQHVAHTAPEECLEVTNAVGFKKFSEVDNKNMFIYDPGGGIFDIFSLAIEETISGGVDVGKRMTAQFLLEHERRVRDIIENIRALKRVRTTFERLKRVFPCTAEIKMKSSLVFELIELYTRITKPGLEVPNRDLFWKYMKLVYRCLKDTKLDKNYIYTVIQNGNSTKTTVAATIILSDKREEKVQELLLCKYVGGMTKDGSKNQNGKEWVAVKIKGEGNWELNVIVSSHDDVDVVAAVQGGVLPKDTNNIIPSKVKPPCIGWVILGGAIGYNEFYLRLLDIDESTIIGQPEFIGSIVNQKVKYLTKRIWCLETEFSGLKMVAVLCNKGQYLSKFMDSHVTGVQLVSKEDMVTENGMRGTCLEVCKIVPRIDTLHMRGVLDIPAANTVIHDLQRYVELSPLEPMCIVEIQASDQAALERMYIILNLSQKYVKMLVEMQKPAAEGKVGLQGIDLYDFQNVGCMSLEIVKNSVYIGTDLDDLDRTFDCVQCHMLNVKLIRIIKASKYSILPQGSAEKKKNYFKGKVRYKCITFSWFIASGDVLQAVIPSGGRNKIQWLLLLDVTLLSLRMGTVRSVRIVFILKITTIPSKKEAGPLNILR